MRTGRLAISRGFSAPEPCGEPARFAPSLAAAPPAPPDIDRLLAPSLETVNARLAALECLTRLCEAGTLSADEFLAEKALILGYPQSNLSVPRSPEARPISFAPARPDRRGRSLMAQLGWSVVPLGLIGGILLSALSQPDATARAFDEAMRLIGL